MRALISVSDRTALEAFARGLGELGWELVASEGTAAFLAEHGLEAARVEALTEMPELLGGRVKTLHPRIHAAILARPSTADVATLEEHEIRPFELVCVNLYPFERVSAESSEDDAVELIDVGGPALLRAAAKNFARVAPVSSPAQYAGVLEELRERATLSLRTRRDLAAQAFAATAAYEARIASWFARGDLLPDRLHLSAEKVADLPYGENPHQRAALYRDSRATEHSPAGAEQLHGRALSYVNLLDLTAARALLADLPEPACAIVKHATPCGVAVAGSPEEAFERALACDPVSAFGMVCAVAGPVGPELAARLAERFVDVLWAPAFEPSALDVLRSKPATRILAGGDVPRARLELRGVPGGFLIQERDAVSESRAEMRVACGSPSEREWADLLFAWTVCRHTSSNAIVLAKDARTLGIGAGQVSRVDAVRIALDKAAAHGHDLRGAVLASDGFFPFADGPEHALRAGVRTIVQPGGSKRDGEVIAVAEAAGAAMVLTGRRHFKH